MGKKHQKGKASASNMQKSEKTRYSDRYGSKDCIQSNLITTAALLEHPLGYQPVYSGVAFSKKEVPAYNLFSTPHIESFL